jgi:hypothetical protein
MTCLGWPAGTECRNIPGTHWGPFWCGPCNEERLAHISANLAAIEAKVRVQSPAQPPLAPSDERGEVK